MKATDTLRELAKIAKSQGNQRLVRIYLKNVKLHRRKATVGTVTE
jgi:hypothetical protein